MSRRNDESYVIVRELSGNYVTLREFLKLSLSLPCHLCLGHGSADTSDDELTRLQATENSGLSTQRVSTVPSGLGARSSVGTQEEEQEEPGRFMNTVICINFYQVTSTFNQVPCSQVRTEVAGTYTD